MKWHIKCRRTEYFFIYLCLYQDTPTTVWIVMVPVVGVSSRGDTNFAEADITAHGMGTIDSAGTLLHKPSVHCQL